MCSGTSSVETLVGVKETVWTEVTFRRFLNDNPTGIMYDPPTDHFENKVACAWKFHSTLKSYRGNKAYHKIELLLYNMSPLLKTLQPQMFLSKILEILKAWLYQ